MPQVKSLRRAANNVRKIQKKSDDVLRSLGIVTEHEEDQLNTDWIPDSSQVHPLEAKNRKWDEIEELYHFFSTLYGWEWDHFWNKVPVGVMNGLTSLILARTKRGYLGHFEVMMTKALLRSKGSKAFD